MQRRRTFLRLILLCTAVPAAACEDLPAGPGGLEGLAANGDATSGLSLRDLFGAALFRVQRDEGTDSAVAVLSRWREASDAGVTTEASRGLEAATVLRVFGPDVVSQAVAVLNGELREVDLAAGRALTDAPAEAVAPVREELEDASAALAEARAMAGASPERALLVLDDVSSRLGRARERLAEATGMPTLERLYRQALDRAGARADEARAREDALTAAIDSAFAEGGLDGRYEAQDALRRHRSAFTVAILGDDVGADLLAGVTTELDKLRPALDSLNDTGVDVSRDRRMAEAAAAIAERAGVALRAGDTARALDLAAHAASLVDELRRIRAR